MSTNEEYAKSFEGFIGIRHAARIAGKSPTWVLRMAMLGRIRTVSEPGEPTRYCRSDVETLVPVAAA